MKCRSSSLLLHSVLFYLFCLLPLSTNADATLYGFSPAYEGEFLTEAFQQTSVVAGTDGVITIVDPSATDEILAHGQYAVTLLESSNGLVYYASGSSYTEYMSCTVDARASAAACVFTASVSGQGTITGAFSPTALPIIAVIPTQSPSRTLSTTATTKQTSSTSSGHGGLSTGVLAGMIAAIAAVVLLLVALTIALVVIRRRRLRLKREQETEIERFDLGRPPLSHPSSSTKSDTMARNWGVPPVTLTSTHSPLDDSTSSSPSEKGRIVYAMDDRSASRLPPTTSEYSDGATVGRSEVDPRELLQEMRRMREEVAHLRTEAHVIPPQYSEN